VSLRLLRARAPSRSAVDGQPAVIFVQKGHEIAETTPVAQWFAPSLKKELFEVVGQSVPQDAQM
jgi:hypothetical protein